MSMLVRYAKRDHGEGVSDGWRACQTCGTCKVRSFWYLAIECIIMILTVTIAGALEELIYALDVLGADGVSLSSSYRGTSDSQLDHAGRSVTSAIT